MHVFLPFHSCHVITLQVIVKTVVKTWHLFRYATTHNNTTTRTTATTNHKPQTTNHHDHKRPHFAPPPDKHHPRRGHLNIGNWMHQMFVEFRDPSKGARLNTSFARAIPQLHHELGLLSPACRKAASSGDAKIFPSRWAFFPATPNISSCARDVAVACRNLTCAFHHLGSNLLLMRHSVRVSVQDTRTSVRGKGCGHFVPVSKRSCSAIVH